MRILTIVVGQIDKMKKHPDADKLIICQVNVGAENSCRSLQALQM